MKRILSFILCLTMIMSFASVVNAEHYSNFTDVKPDSWYYEDVDNAVRLGIINGKTETTFAPDDNLTYAEAIKLAACMYQLYKDGSVYLVPGGNPWYQIYVDYAKDHGIITENFFYKVSNINEKATRAGYMEIFANALPDEALIGINNVPDGSIPDVPMVHESSIGIYKLYRAGILTGVDAKHNCKPEDNIKRCEVAAIITRMMDETKRVKFSMGTTSEEPKTEEPKTEELKEEQKLEIPEDAEPAPEIKEDEKSAETPETPDMYEPFEIVVEPERIDSADEGETLTYTVKASGGKTPYTYSWGTRDRYNGFTEFTESDYVKGAKTNTLSLVFDIDNATTSQFYCKITDALGQEVKSESVTIPEKVFIFKPENVTKYNSGYIFTGRVEKGALRAGETVSMHALSHGIEVYGVVTGIEMFNKRLDEAKQGDYCGILIEEPKEIPYNMWVVETLGVSLTARVQSLGNYGFKVPMKLTFQYGGIKNLGETVTMRMHVKGGTPPYTYEWYKFENGNEYTKIVNDHKYNVMGSEVRIIVDADEFEQNMWYRCDVTDAAGNTQYETWYGAEPEATPYLSRQPKDVYADYGEEAVFKVHTRCASATYQWYIKNDNTNGWKKIEPTDTWAKGATTSTLKIQVEKADFVSHCEYRCDVKNGAYGVVSNSAKLLPKDIVITEQPKNVSAKHAEKAKFKVVAEGENGPFTYQWLIQTPDNEIPLMITEAFPWAEGYYTDTLSVAVDENKLTSDYKFSCIVTDKNGVRRISNEAYVIVTADANVSFDEEKSKDSMIVIMP